MCGDVPKPSCASPDDLPDLNPNQQSRIVASGPSLVFRQPRKIATPTHSRPRQRPKQKSRVVPQKATSHEHIYLHCKYRFQNGHRMHDLAVCVCATLPFSLVGKRSRALSAAPCGAVLGRVRFCLAGEDMHAVRIEEMIFPWLFLESSDWASD